MRVAMADRARRGRSNHVAGLMAEDGVERLYRARGAAVLDRRRRIGGGELDLVALDGEELVFVEVKRRRRRLPDSLVAPAQWRRLEAAASAYIVEHAEKTGAHRRARFDVVLVDGDARAEVVRNARGIERDEAA